MLEEAELAERARKQAEREATDADTASADRHRCRRHAARRRRDASPPAPATPCRAAVDAGAQFVLATGRPPRWMHPVVDALGFAPMAVCANGAVIYDPATDRIVVRAHAVGRRRWPSSPRSPTRAIPGAGLAVERVGRSAHDAATPQFVSSPGYEHAWLNPDNTEVSVEDLLSAPAVKLLIRKAGARSADMAAELAKHVGLKGISPTAPTTA